MSKLLCALEDFIHAHAGSERAEARRILRRVLSTYSLKPLDARWLREHGVAH